MLPIKHTPGPWRLERYENSVCGIGARVVSADGRTICDDEPYYPKAVNEHDAALIAAAPALLAALVDLLTIANERGAKLGLDEGGPVLENARAAIAQARDA